MSEHGKCHIFRSIFTALTRAVALAYVALAVLATLDTRLLLQNSEITMSKNEILYPFELCTPSSFEVDGNTFGGGFQEGSTGCQKIDFLVNSCAAGLIFSAIASAFFVLIDCSARRKCCGPFNASGSYGTGILLFFILIQAGISVGALVEQIEFYVGYLNELSDITSSPYKVRSYANIPLLETTAIFALATALLTFIDAVLYLGCRKPEKQINSDKTFVPDSPEAPDENSNKAGEIA